MADLSTRPWWTFVPEQERRLYQRAGFSRPQSFEGRPALLVIDCTLAFTGSGPLPVEDAVAEWPTACGAHAWESLTCVQQLLSAFRAARLPVVFTRADLAAQAAAQGATKASVGRDRARAERGNEFPEPVRPLPDEWVCDKARASAFYGTPLASFLQLRGVRSVVVCGGTTSGCVRASAVDAFSAGFQVFVAEDACFDRARTPHLANLFDLHAKYATVLTTTEVLDQLAVSVG